MKIISKFKIIPYLIIMSFLLVAVMATKVFTGLVTPYFVAIYAVVLVGFSVVYFLVVLKKSIEKIYLAAGLFLGLTFMLVIPPNGAADENNHYYKCFDFANVFWGKELVEDSKYHYLRDCDANLNLDKVISLDDYLYIEEIFWDRADSSELKQVYVDDVTYENKDLIYYIPAILGIILGRLLGMGGIGTYMVARLFLFGTYMFITYWALKKIPVFKREFTVLLLMPSVISRVASVTYDTLLMACIFWFISNVIYYMKKQTVITIKDAILMIIAGIGLTVGKGGAYIPFLLLMFLIPKKCFGERIKYPLVVAVSIGISFLAYCLCNFSLFADVIGSASSIENDLLWTEEEGYTIKYILTHPKQSIIVLVNTFMRFGYKWFGETIGDGYGWLQVYVSPFLIVAYTILIIFSTISREDEEIFTGKQRVFMGIVAILSCILVVLSMWIFWTPLSYELIVGVQGRYFIPMLILIVAAIKSKNWIMKKDVTPAILIVSVMITSLNAFNILTAVR